MKERFSVDGDDLKRLDAWLARLGGPGYKGFEDRDEAVAEMRATGTDRLLPLLIPMLAAEDAETRCAACEAILWVDTQRGVELVLPLLNDADEVVRWVACECLGSFGDERCVSPLVAVLQSDEDAMVRGTAARALGKLGDPAVIPALLATMASDHEKDMHGHSPSGCAATALDDLVDTNETRIKISETLCRMRKGKADLDRLRRLAEERYQPWLGSRADKPVREIRHI